MERENQRKYPVFENLSTDELEKLLAQDFTADGGEEPDVEYIMAIMGVINEREKAAGRQTDVDAAWKDFQENYQGQAAAFDRTIHCETESSNHHKSSTAQTPHKKTRVFRYVIAAVLIVALLGGTASGFGRVFQAMVNWTAETFGFESPYEEEAAAETVQEDVYANLRSAVAEYTDISVVPNWAPEGTVKASDASVQMTARKDSMQLSGIYETAQGRFNVRIRIYEDIPADYRVSYQWNESVITTHIADGISHYIVENNEKNVAAWTNETVECVIQGDVSVEDLKRMIDSIYQE